MRRRLVAALLPWMVCSCSVIPVLQQQGGTAYVNACRLTRPRDWEDFRRVPDGLRAPVAEVVVIPVYEHKRFPELSTFEIFDPVVVKGDGGEAHFPWRVNFSSSHWTALGWIAPPDKRPQPWAIAFARGCWPLLLRDESNSNSRNGFCLPSQMIFANDDRRPPKGYFASMGCIFIPGGTEGRDTFACVNRAGGESIAEKPPRLLQVIGETAEAQDQFVEKVDRAGALSAEQKDLVYRQLIRVLEEAGKSEDNAPYLQSIIRLKERLAEKTAPCGEVDRSCDEPQNTPQ